MTALVSIILPAFNCEKYLGEAINSCLNQTFPDFELIVINDGSTDNTDEVINSFSDPRIVHVTNDKNLGLIRTLNKGFKLSQGAYIARMDADDICLPERLALQLSIMQTDQSLSVVGGRAIIIDSLGRVCGRPRFIFQSHDEILADAFFRCPLMHPTVMFRRKAILDDIDLGLYSINARHCEDYELWTRLLLKGRFANVPSILLRYRKHDDNISVKYQDEALGRLFTLSSRLFKDFSGIELAPEFFRDLHRLNYGESVQPEFFSKSSFGIFRSVRNDMPFFATRFNIFLFDALIRQALKCHLHTTLAIIRNLCFRELPQSVLLYLTNTLSVIFYGSAAKTKKYLHSRYKTT